ncbi:EAL domain-containing protein [Cellulomonas hominis]
MPATDSRAARTADPAGPAGPAGRADPGPTGHYAARTISDLLAYLEHHLPAEEVAELLAEAGESRPVAEVRRDATWTSRDWYTGLVSAASEHLGGAEELTKVVPWAHRHTTPPEFLSAIRSVGNARDSIDGFTRSVGSFDPAIEMSLTAATDSTWAVELRRRPGVPTLRGTCALYRGLVSAIPALFGDRPALVIETACQCDGAPACRFAVTLRPRPAEERRLALLALDVRLQESRLDNLRRLVEEIGSGTDLRGTLHRTLVTAMTATAATGAVMAAREDGEPVMILAEGLTDAEAQQLGTALLDGHGCTDDVLVTDVSSARRRHGLIAVLGVRPALHPPARRILDTYAHLAAGVLDIHLAVGAARRQAETATALLDLAVSLSDIDSPRRLARRLARGVPGLIGFDRAAVFLADAAGSPMRFRAGHGYDPDAPEPVLPPEVGDGSADPRLLPADPAHPGLRRLVAPLGDGVETVGWLLAEADASTLVRGADVDRLALAAGAAAQATVALANARLLDQISHQALHDPLTGVGNRALLQERTAAALAHRRPTGEVAVLFLDLDGFKTVNDTYGHSAGDQVLRAVADRLRAVTRAEDLVARMGGDEFVVLIEDTRAESDPEILAERVLAVLGEPYVLTGPVPTTVLLTVSIGIAIGIDTSADELLRDADIALYRAKSAGKNKVIAFEAAMQASRLARHQLGTDLRAALAADELFLLWQPVVDLDTGTIPGAEALLRWEHPSLGTIGPATLLPLLDEIGMIQRVGRWVLTTACEQASRWHAAGHRIAVSVNVSARQLAEETFVDDVIRIVTAAGLNPGHLVLEISETTLMHDLATATERLGRLKGAGISIAVDNFGTAYSSLAQLSALPIDAIKIDRSLIAAIAGTSGMRALVHTLVEMGHALGVMTLAEGVEFAEQDDQVRAESFDAAQGFLFSPPVPADELAELLRSGVGAGPASGARGGPGGPSSPGRA